MVPVFPGFGFGMGPGEKFVMVEGEEEVEEEATSTKLFVLHEEAATWQKGQPRRWRINP